MIPSSSGSENLSDDDGEELDIGNNFSDWAIIRNACTRTRNACTRTASQEAIGILRWHWHRVPEDAWTLFHTPRHLQDKCGA